MAPSTRRASGARRDAAARASRRSARSSSGLRPAGAPDDRGVEQLASFAVRAAHALRSSERARDAALELERTPGAARRRRARRSRSSRWRTRSRRRSSASRELLGSDRVAVYLTDEDEPSPSRRAAGSRAPIRRSRSAS